MGVTALVMVVAAVVSVVVTLGDNIDPVGNISGDGGNISDGVSGTAAALDSKEQSVHMDPKLDATHLDAMGQVPVSNSSTASRAFQCPTALHT